MSGRRKVLIGISAAARLRLSPRFGSRRLDLRDGKVIKKDSYWKIRTTE